MKGLLIGETSLFSVWCVPWRTEHYEIAVCRRDGEITARGACRSKAHSHLDSRDGESEIPERVASQIRGRFPL